MKQQVLQCDETELMYYINNGWDIITSVPNPFPQPRVFFYVKRFYEELPDREELEEIVKNAQEFSRENNHKFY